MHEDLRDSLIGGLVMTVLLAVMAIVYVGDFGRRNGQGYDLLARFRKADGLAIGSEVRLSGVVVGRITAQALDAQFYALLTLHLDPGVLLPKDSNASIQTDGLLGEKYVSLQPGGDEQNLAPGAQIAYTQDSLALDDLLDMIIAQAKAAHGISDSKTGARQ